MSKIQNIAVVGAGAMGLLYASQFYGKENFKIRFAAYGNRYKKLQESKFIFNGRQYDFDIIDLANNNNTADLIIIAVKFNDLTETISQINSLVGDNTIIISLLNGLDSENELAQKYGSDKILLSITVGMDAVRTDNCVTCKNFGKLVFGEKENYTLSENVLRLKEAFDIAGINYDIPANMLKEMWWKFMINVGVNQTSAVLRSNYGKFQSSSSVRDIMENLMIEVIELSKLEGVNLDYEHDLKNRWYQVLYKLDPNGKSSMLQDIEAKRNSEVDIFSGKIIKLSKKYNYNAVYNTLFYQLIKAIESSY